MLQTNKIFFLLCFLIAVICTKSQVITGYHDCKMRYVFLNPIGQPPTGSLGPRDYSFDLDGDSNNDFKITFYNSGGLGGNSQGAYITSLGNGQIAFGWTDSVFSVGCNPQWRFYDRPDTLNINDSINQSLDWRNTYFTFWASGYLMGGIPPCSYSSPNDPSYNNKYIGLRVFENSDTLYGWIKLKYSPSIGIEEICCEIKQDQIQIIENIHDTVLVCGTSLKYQTNVVSKSCATYQWSKDGIDISGAITDSLNLGYINLNDSGIYTCTIINAFDTIYCISKLTVLFPPPITSPSIDNTTIIVCEGWTQSQYFVVNSHQNNVVSYQWIKDGMTLTGETNDSIALSGVNVSLSGKYSCKTIVQINDYCNDTIYLQEFGTNEVQFDVKAKTNPLITQVGNQLISNYPIGNIWYFRDCCTYESISNEQTITMQKEGQYSLYVQSNYCSGQTNWQDFYYQFAITPNPFEDEITVSLKNDQLYNGWELLNNLGVAVLKGTLTSMQNTINTSTIAKGHYYLKINGQVMKMIKQ